MVSYRAPANKGLTYADIGNTIVILYCLQPTMPNPVTSLKIPVALKDRVASVIEGTEQSPHAFMVEAIERQTSLAEKRRQFLAEADAAEQEMLTTGKGYEGDKVHAYLRAHVQGKKAKRPKAKTWRS